MEASEHFKMQSRFQKSSAFSLKRLAQRGLGSSNDHPNSLINVDGLSLGNFSSSSSSIPKSKLDEPYQFKDDLQLDHDPPLEEVMLVDGENDDDDPPKTTEERVESRLENRRFATEEILDPLIGECDMLSDSEIETMISNNPIPFKMDPRHKFGSPTVIRRPQNTLGFSQFCIPQHVTLTEFGWSSYNVAGKNTDDWSEWDKLNRFDDERAETFSAHKTSFPGRLANPHSSDAPIVNDHVFGQVQPSSEILAKDFSNATDRSVNDLDTQRSVQNSLNLQAAGGKINHVHHNGNDYGGAVLSQKDLDTSSDLSHIPQADSYHVGGHGIVVYAQKGEFLLKDLSNAHLKDFRNFLWRMKCGRFVYSLGDYIHKDVQYLITKELATIESRLAGDWIHRSPSDDAELVEALIKLHPDSHDKYAEFSFEQRVKFMDVPHFDPLNAFGSLNDLVIHLTRIHDDMTIAQRTPQNIKLMSKLLHDEKFKIMHSAAGPPFAELFHTGGLPDEFEQLTSKILTCANQIHTEWLMKRKFDEAKNSGNKSSNYQNAPSKFSNNSNPKTSNGSSGHSGGNGNLHTKAPQGGKAHSGTDGERPRSSVNLNVHPQNGTWAACHGCGMFGHLMSDCNLKDHPDFNSDRTKAFNQSAAWPTLQETAQKKGIAAITCLNKRLDAHGRPLNHSSDERTVGAKAKQGQQQGSGGAHSHKKQQHQQQAESKSLTYLSALSANVLNSGAYTVPCLINLSSQSTLPINALIDWGSLQDNFVSSELAARMASQVEMQVGECSCVGGECSCHIANVSSIESKGGGFVEPILCKRTDSVYVCSGLKDCRVTDTVMSFYFTFCNDLTNSLEKILISALIIDTKYDVIIGRNDIIKYDLIKKLDKHFNPKKYLGVHTACGKNRDVNETQFNMGTSSCCSECEQGKECGKNLSTLNAFARAEQAHISYLNSVISGESSKYDHVEDDDEIEYEDEFYLPVSNFNSNNNSSMIKPHIEGDEELQQMLNELCDEFADIFSTELRTEPADIPPLDIKLKPTADGTDPWRVPRNRGPARLQSAAKQADLYKQIQVMKANNVIKESNSPEYSQILLVPKPDHTWRICVDYRFLNDVTTTESWPIPNIALMLERIGRARPKIYGLMDLTKGYHQAPLTIAAQILTQFITLFGIYCWLRVPMGVKQAPGYFQQTMATIVLIGLLYFICEVYLDDILVYAQTNVEFINNLREVFLRMRKHKLTLNPKKCKFGMSVVQFVGHELSGDTISFSLEKKRTVLDFPLPKTVKALHTFLGLANYFRAHVRNHSAKAAPLNKMIEVGNKHKVLKWTDETVAAFNQLRNDIANCPSLYFMDPDAPVYLQTDASDYGAGAYLFQKDIQTGEDKPVMFLSKTFIKEQLRWSVPEKEGYAIFWAFNKLDYLLRDIKFILQTDHKNLIYINTSGSPKVVRWKLAIQSYNFEIHHIAGVKNIVADAMSRLCNLESFDEPPAHNELDTFVVPRDKYELIKAVHNEIAGHHGLERTLAKLKIQHNEWMYMREHIKWFIKHCPLCQKLSYDNIIKKTEPFTVSRYEPMECLNIDSIGPMPDDWYILVIIDCFTRFVELYAVPDTTALEASKCLLEHFGRYGSPAQIRSDRGTQFANDLIEEFLKLVGTEHLLTVPYSSQHNAIVERSNKEVMRHLRAIIFEKNIIDGWRYSLPLVQRIMNASVHDAIGVSPAQLLFGNSITLDRGVIIPSTSDGKEVNLSDWAKQMLDKQEELLKVAQQKQSDQNSHKIQSLIAKEGENYTEYPVNSYVLVNYHNRPPSKLHTNLKGPLRVVSFDKSIYVLQDLVTNRLQNIHISNLRPFLFDQTVTDPRLVANADKQMFDVERIVSHTGHPRKKSTMTFTVEWVGYGPDETTVQPWADLRDNVKLHEYLIAHGFGKYISKKFIQPHDNQIQNDNHNVNAIQSMNCVDVDSDNDSINDMDIVNEDEIVSL